MNRERVKWLYENGLIHPGIENKVWNIISEPFIFPHDIINKIEKNKTAWKNYQQFIDLYKRIRIAYIDDARKRSVEFEKRLNNFINKLIRGYSGIEKYYLLYETFYQCSKNSMMANP